MLYVEFINADGARFDFCEVLVRPNEHALSRLVWALEAIGYAKTEEVTCRDFHPCHHGSLAIVTIGGVPVMIHFDKDTDCVTVREF